MYKKTNVIQNSHRLLFGTPTHTDTPDITIIVAAPLRRDAANVCESTYMLCSQQRALASCLRACSTLHQPHCMHVCDHTARNTDTIIYKYMTGERNTHVFLRNVAFSTENEAKTVDKSVDQSFSELHAWAQPLQGLQPLDL